MAERTGHDREGVTSNSWTEPHEHNEGAAGAPGASGPGEQAYEGDVQVNVFSADEGALANAEGGLQEGEQVPPEVQEAWSRAEDG